MTLHASTPLAYAQIRSCCTLANREKKIFVDWTYHRVPRTSAERKSIVADAQTADTVVVTLQCTDSLTAESIPDLAEVSIFQ